MAHRRGLGRRAGIRIAFAFTVVGLGALPAACLYPEFSFTEPETSGSGGGVGSSASSSSSGAGGMGSASSSSSSGQGGASSSSSASSSSGSSSSSSSSGIGGGPTGEDCLNGIDDDGDNAVDCADSECVPVTTCAPTVPFGWSGLAVLFEGVPAQEPACPAAFPSPNPYVGDNTPIAGNAACSACSCGAPAGQTCDLPDKYNVQNKACGMNPSAMGTVDLPPNWGGACYGQVNYPGGQTTCGGPCNVALTAPAPTVTGGTCPTGGGVPSVPALKWAIRGKACGDSSVGAGCGAGKACLPKPPQPFLGGLCIYKSGENACPAGDFSVQHVFYEGADDTRGCGACSCGAPAGSTCAASIDVYNDLTIDTCVTKVATIPAGGCVDLLNNPTVSGAKATITQPPTGGSCVPSGGQSMGQVTPTTPTTFCCTP